MHHPFRTAAALAICTAGLFSMAVPALAAESYTPPDVSGKSVEELIDAFREEHNLDETNFELSYYNTVSASVTVDMPTASPPRMRMARISAGVSNCGPGMKK